MIRKLFNFIDEKEEEYINFLKDICSFETNSRDKENIDKMVDYIERFALSNGFSVKRTVFETCGDFLTIDLNEGAEKGNMFLSHMDTVHKNGDFGYPCVKIEGEHMQGPGAIDCKGGIAIAFLVMRTLKEQGFKKHTRLILTSDEEISNILGGEEEQEFFKDSVKGFKSALNCETARGNEVVVSRKGILRKKIDIKGRGGHSGIDYFRASSAILEAAHKIVELEKNSSPGGTTYNCSIVNGGQTANCIPESCSFCVDVRAVDLEGMEKAEKLIDRIVEKSFVSGTSATVKEVSRRIPMERNAGTDSLFNRMNEISMKYDLGRLVPVESGGGSDSAYTHAAGVPSLCGLGGSGDFCHTNKEYIDLKSITKRAKMLTAFCLEI